MYIGRSRNLKKMACFSDYIGKHKYVSVISKVPCRKKWTSMKNRGYNLKCILNIGSSIYGWSFTECFLLWHATFSILKSAKFEQFWKTNIQLLFRLTRTKKGDTQGRITLTQCTRWKSNSCFSLMIHSTTMISSVYAMVM